MLDYFDMTREEIIAELREHEVFDRAFEGTNAKTINIRIAKDGRTEATTLLKSLLKTAIKSLRQIRAQNHGLSDFDDITMQEALVKQVYYAWKRSRGEYDDWEMMELGQFPHIGHALKGEGLHLEFTVPILGLSRRRGMREWLIRTPPS